MAGIAGANYADWMKVGLLFFLNDQRDAQFFSMYFFLFLPLYMFRAHRAYHQER